MPVLTFNHQSTPMCFPDPFLVLVRILLKLCSWRKSYHCVHYGLMQDQSILLQGCHCCFAILILISHLFLSTLSLAGIQVSLLTHLIHYLPFPFSPDNNYPTLLRNSQVAKNAFLFLFFFLISTLKQQTFIEYQSCAGHHAWAVVCQKWYSWLIFVYTTYSTVPGT